MLEQFENDGNAALAISSVSALNSNFAAASSAVSYFLACGSTLVIGDTCGLSFQYAPRMAAL